MECPHGRDAACHACYMRVYRSQPDRAAKHRAEVSEYQRRHPEVNRAASARYYAKKRDTRPPRPTFQERFWARVEKGDGCWLWTASTFHSGHGQVRYQHRTQRAHRVAWELLVGPIPDGAILMHVCDVPRCVNPEHLRPGTQKDNMADAAAKGRIRNQYS